MIQQKDLEKLLSKYKQGTCTPEEKAFVESWYLSYEDNPVKPLSASERTDDLDEVWSRLVQSSQKKRIKLWPWIAAAVVFLIFISTGLFIYNQRYNKAIQLTQNHIKPGGNKAILTLANGQKINLTDIANGQLAD